MMIQYKKELSKLFRNQLFIFLLLFSIVLQFILFIFEQQDDVTSTSAYKEMYAQVSKKDPSLDEVQAAIKKLTLFSEFNAAENNTYYISIDELKTQNPKAYKEWKYHKKLTAEEISLQSEVYNDYYNQKYHIQNYSANLKTKEKILDKKANIKFFEDSNKIKQEKKQLAQLKNIAKQNMKYQNDNSFSHYITWTWNDILFILFAFFIVFLIIKEEKEKNLFCYFKSMSKTRHNFIFIKFLAMITSIIFVGLILYGESLLLSISFYSICDLNVPIQSNLLFSEATIAITMLNYMIYSFIIKVIVLLAFASFTLLVYCILNFSIAILSSVSILTIGYFMSSQIKELSSTAYLKYLNFYSLFFHEDLLGYTKEMQIGNNTISYIVLGIIFSLIIIILSFIILKHRFKYSNFEQKYLVNRISLYRSTNVCFQEIYKLFYKKKFIILTLFIVLFGGYYVNQYQQYLDIDKGIYEQYCIRYEGELTKSNKEQIQIEIAQLNHELEKNPENSEAGSIINVLNSLMKKDYIYNDESYSMVAEEKSEAPLRFIILITCIISIIAVLCCFDEDFLRKEQIRKTTKFGSYESIKTKLIIVTVLTYIAGITLYSCYFLAVNKTYNFHYLIRFDAQSFELLTLLIVKLLAKLSILCVILHLFIWLMLKYKHRFIPILIFLYLLFDIAFLYNMGFHNISLFSQTDISVMPEVCIIFCSIAFIIIKIIRYKRHSY